MACSVKKYSQLDLKELLPWPAKDAHKYSRGKLLVVGGCARYPGAASLAAHATQRVGAGYVEVACAPESVPAVQGAHPSLVVRSWCDLGRGDFSGYPENRAGKPVAYVVGPGFDGGDAERGRIARFVLERAQAPVLVDGGALDVLAEEEGRAILKMRAQRGLVTVITPHGGEAARLARAASITLDGLHACDIATHLALSYGVVCVLKGSDTFVSDGEIAYVMAEGTSALAKAGTGDVLAGAVGALLAQGLEPVDAAMLGATLHARAGIAAAERYTSIGVTAEDVIDCIPVAIRSLFETVA